MRHPLTNNPIPQHPNGFAFPMHRDGAAMAYNIALAICDYSVEQWCIAYSKLCILLGSWGLKVFSWEVLEVLAGRPWCTPVYAMCEDA